MTKKGAAAPCSETPSAKKLKKFTDACKFGVNRLRIDGDIRQKVAITAIMENVVIAIYRLRPIAYNNNNKGFTAAVFITSSVRMICCGTMV